MKNHKYRFGIVLLMWIGAFCSACGTREEIYFATSETTEMNQTDADEEERITASVVYVCGYVVSPGVYELAEGARICDALKAAGGLLPEASEEYWNQAELVTDGQKIYVPSVEEVENSGAARETAKEEDGRININTATREELMSIPGVGATRADSILVYREKNSMFRTPEDIKNVPGIKDGVYMKLEQYIKVE